MKLYQWLTRGFHDGRIVEVGETVVCADTVIPGPHMLDVATGLRGGQTPPPPPPPPGAIVLPQIMDLMAQMGAAHPQVIAPDGRLLTFDADHGGYQYAQPAPSNVVQLKPDTAPSEMEAP